MLMDDDLWAEGYASTTLSHLGVLKIVMQITPFEIQSLHSYPPTLASRTVMVSKW